MTRLSIIIASTMFFFHGFFWLSFFLIFVSFFVLVVFVLWFSWVFLGVFVFSWFLLVMLIIGANIHTF